MHIAIIDDEKILSSWIGRKLTQDWFDVTIFNSLWEYNSQIIKKVDLYIIDISLWDGSWFDIIHNLKNDSKKKNIPILLISGHSNINTKVEWLNIWADDYLVKPFNPKELLARVSALLRRKDNPVHKTIVKYRDYLYDREKKELYYKWNIIPLTKKERQILEIFLQRKNSLIKKSTLINDLWWEHSLWVTENTLNVTICNLRKKLWDDFLLITRVWEWYLLQNEK